MMKAATGGMTLFAAGALLLAGCAGAYRHGDAHSLSDLPAPVVTTVEERTEATARHWTSAVQARDPVDQRLTLETLLGHHATLAVRLMRGRLDKGDEFTRVAVDAVVRNTQQLTDAVASVYGSEGGAAFEELWSDHVQSLFAYAAAVAEEDAAAMEQAQDDLDTYIDSFASFVESATEGEVASADVAAGLAEHIDLLLRQLDAYEAGDFQTAFDLQRQAYTHMFPTGRLLSEGMAAHHPGELPVAIDEASGNLRSALGQLLGEHVELAIDAMRAGVTGEPYFEEAAGALNANTMDLTEAIGALFGADNADQFNTLWADHIDAFVQYTAALAEGNEDDKEAALDSLHGFHTALGEHLSDMTGGHLTAATAAEALRVHDEQLVEQIETYAAEDYATAYEVSFDAYQHVFDTAAALAEAIEAHVGPQLPVGGAQTGAGGAAAHAQHRP